MVNGSGGSRFPSGKREFSFLANLIEICDRGMTCPVGGIAAFGHAV